MCVGLLTLVCLGACTVRVYSPPTGSFPVESSATLGKNGNSVRGEAAWAGEVFGPTISSYRVSVARGLTDQLDLSLAPALTWIHGSTKGEAHPGIYALRAGLKYAPIPYFAVIGGLGAGASAGGGFLSPDLGFITAFENPYLIPFFALRGLLSAPLNAQQVRFTTDDDADRSDEDTERDVYALTPRFTYGAQANAGLRVPLVPAGHFRVEPAFACALGFTTLYSRQNRQATYGGLSCAVDARF